MSVQSNADLACEVLNHWASQALAHQAARDALAAYIR